MIQRTPGNGRFIAVPGRKEERINYIDSTAKIRVVTINIVPLQLRRNFNKYFGAGIGTLVSFNLDKQAKPIRTIVLEATDTGTSQPIEKTFKKISSSFNDFQNTLFADIQLGKVYVGPAIGFRYLYTLQHNNNRLITYLMWKF
ncbi:hypothetical protein D3C85_1445480 [compost metagenome]